MALDKLTKVQSVGISSFIQVVGVVTATGGFVGDITGNVTGTTSNASGATGDFSIADKIVHTGDTNTAIRFPAADTITAETAGSERLRITSAGHVGIDCTPNDHNSFTRALDVNGPSGAAVYMRTNDSTSNCFIVGNYGSEAYINNIANGNIRFFTQGVEKFRISNTGLVGIGTVSPSGSIHAHAASGTQRSYLEASAAHSFLRLKSGSTSYNSGIEFFSGASNIANINGLGGGGLQFEVNGSERLRIDSSGNIGMGGITSPSFTTGSGLHLGDNFAIGFGAGGNSRPDFQIVSDGSSLDFRCGFGADTADISMTTGGNLVFASGGGIDFSATGDANGMTSELLDDYEEGTWTPDFVFGSSSTGISYHTRNGRYVKVGKMVMLRGGFVLSNKGTATGQSFIGGFPYTVESVAYADATGIAGAASLSGTNGPPVVVAQNNQNKCLLWYNNSSGGRVIMTNGNFANNSEIYFTLVYTTT